jgi:hypothetical protein
MSEGYTPGTENIRNCYIYSNEQYDGSLLIPVSTSSAEFDRWLAAHDAEVASAAWDKGHKTRHRRGPDKCRCSAWSAGECACGRYGTGELLSLKDNPYRTGVA